MDIPVLIIHYNTPELTSATVKSVWKHTPQAKITIFDNSDKRPFPINDFPEIRYIDNTKGLIVNWDEWLELFPNKTHTTNNWGSSKHCYSVEVCFDYFPEGFILMDSDILISKDFSNIYDKSVPYYGTISRNSQMKKYGHGLTRVCPFLCFINVPLLRKFNIHYFRKDKTYALCGHDVYEPGTLLLEECKKYGLNGKTFSLYEYYKHFGAGSTNFKNKDYEGWLKKYKNLYTYDKVIVTILTNNYEFPTDNFKKREEYDYILISDVPIKTNCWKNIVFDIDIVSNKKLRYIKTHLWEILSNYKFICYIDANTYINDKLYNYIDNNSQNLITFKLHPKRNCIYDEINACCKLKKESKEMGEKLKERYIFENYPKNNGLFETNIIIFNPNNEDIKELFKKWWEEIYNNSHRDQLSLNYVIWKYHFENIISSAISSDFSPKKHLKYNKF